MSMFESDGNDYQTVTRLQRETWATGDFNEIARQNVWMAEDLCREVDPHANERILDVACGSGTAALVAARRYSQVAGIDFVPGLIERARTRAIAEGLQIEFAVADAQSLPFPDASFDVVLSVYGLQFAPDQAKAASELLRVCRPGGKIGLATPIPEGWSGDFFAVSAKYSPAKPGLRPPLYWGTEEGLDELLGPGTHSIHSEKRTALQYYRSIDHAAEVFLSNFGPINRAWEGSDEEARLSLRSDLRNVFARYNRASDGTAVIENRYLLTTAVRS